MRQGEQRPELAAKGFRQTAFELKSLNAIVLFSRFGPFKPEGVWLVSAGVRARGRGGAGLGPWCLGESRPTPYGGIQWAMISTDSERLFRQFLADLF